MQNNLKYNIIIMGCQMNKSDSERIAAYLDDLGYEQTKERNKADLVILTTCGVRQEAESRIYGFVPRIRKENPQVKIVLTGCLSERDDVKRRLGKGVDVWLPIRDLGQFSSRLNGTDPIDSSREYLDLRSKHKSSFLAYVPIGNGCDNFCTYCVVPYARGREVYRPFMQIVKEVKKLADSGYKEIVLIAQNVNSYHSDFPINFLAEAGLRNEFPELYEYLGKIDKRELLFSDLLQVCAQVAGDFWLRFSTSHPKDMSDDLIRTVAENPKICRQIHLPAQAGDNEVLTLMNRKYSREDYLSLTKKIREAFNIEGEIENAGPWLPPVAISTDIIVGFPSETREQFEKTSKLFWEAEFDMAYLARYSPRPGTAAERLADDIPAAEKKKREEELNDILRVTALRNNQAYLDKTVKVLVDELNSKGELLGKTETSKTVRILNAKELDGEPRDFIGRFLFVRITEVKDFGMNGVV